MARKKNNGDFKETIVAKLKCSDKKEVALSTPKKVETQKKVISKKSELTEDAEELFSDLRVVFSAKQLSCTDFQCYSYIPEDRRITKHTDVGSRVIVAKYPMFYKIYFMEYIDVGKPHFPHGGIKIYNATFEQTQYFYYESVALHPTKKDKYRVKNLDE